MTTLDPPCSGQCRVAPRFGRSRAARRVAAVVAFGAVLFPSVADGSPAGGAVPTVEDEPVAETSAPVDNTSIFDDLTVTEVIETLADDDFVFDGRNILVEDPAPFGPFTGDGFGDPHHDAHGHDFDGVSGAAIEATGSAGELTGAFGTLGLSEALSLHSRPEATRTIFLDFDGHTVTGTAWNSTVPTIEAGRYRRGSTGSPDSGFTQSELDGIVEIWERVAEDFAAWDVDVTTEDPGADALMRSGFGDDEYGIRTIITPDHEWYDTRPFGGVAYLRSFSRSSDLPAWAFSSNLGSGDPKSVAEAVSHEVGHTLGLQHDGIDNGTSSSSYYSGHGTWAPIMGAGYYREVTQWSNGDYPGATNTEDDLAIIDGFIDRLPADFGGAVIPGEGASTTRHILGASGGTSTHSLEVAAGPLTITVGTPGSGGNLLAGLTVRDSAGEIVASASSIHPATWSLSADLPADVAPGTYTIDVRSVGWSGNGGDDPGFSSYGSIGTYALTVEMGTSGGTTTTTNPGPPPPPPPPDSEGVGDGLRPIRPLRVLDTRAASSPTNGRLRAGQNLRLDLAAAPEGTAAAVVNIVATDSRSTGWLSVTPCTNVASDERTSSINFSPGGSVANSIVAPMTTSGEICIYASSATHVVVDVTGWIGAAGSLTLDETGSVRVVDTREGLGIPRQLRAGTTVEIDLSDALSGDDIGAVALNLTAIRSTARGYLTVDNCSSAKTTSSLNVAAGEVRSNNGIFGLGNGQRLCISTTTTTHLTVDITGEFGTDAGLRFVAASPARVLDTRNERALTASSSTAFELPSASATTGLSTSPAAASVNLTATRSTASAFVTSWDCGSRPETSALNPTAGAATANGALVPLSPTGTSCLFHSKGGHLIVDLSGWWI